MSFPLARIRALVRVLLVLGCIAFAASVFLRGEAGTELALDAGLYNVPFVAAALLCFLHRGPDRRAWAVLGLGLVAFAAANVYSTVWLSGLDDPPYPSAADAAWLAFYPLAYACLAQIARRRLAGSQRDTWLDGLIAAFGGTAVASALVLGPILAGTEGSFAVVATNLAYPTGDLLLLTFVIGLATVAHGRLGGSLLLVGAGFAVFAVADSIFLAQEAQGTYVEGGPLDLGWPLAAVLLGIAATLPADRIERREPARFVALPIVFAVAALAVLGVQPVVDVPGPAVLLAAATLALALLRVWLAFRDLRALATARSQARTDDLTGLANRRAFAEMLDARLTESSPHDAFSVMLIDLDRFKEVNDSLGHQAGDRLLALVSQRLRGVVDTGSLLARLGGDEFAAVVGLGADRADAVARKVATALAAPFALDGLTVHAPASIGIAAFPAHGTTSEALLARADIAMYAAKAERSGVAVYEHDRDHESQGRLLMIDSLRRALRDAEMTVFYQPILGVPGSGVHAIEALVRWQHPSRGLLAPGCSCPSSSRTG